MKGMDLTRVPFGFDLQSGRLVDAASVPRGLKCGCVCPSCKIALVARHGDVNEWHFAHASRNDKTRVERQCDFSFEPRWRQGDATAAFMSQL
jgi:hypothetical protein